MRRSARRLKCERPGGSRREGGRCLFFSRNARPERPRRADFARVSRGVQVSIPTGRPRSRFASPNSMRDYSEYHQQPVGYSCPAACEDVRRRPAARAQSRRRRRLARWHVPARPSPRASPCSRRAFPRARLVVSAPASPPAAADDAAARGRVPRATTALRSSRSPRSPRASPWASSRASPSTHTRACAWSRAAAPASRDGRPLRPSRVPQRFHPVRLPALPASRAVAIPACAVTLILAPARRAVDWRAPTRVSIFGETAPETHLPLGPDRLGASRPFLTATARR